MLPRMESTRGNDSTRFWRLVQGDGQHLLFLWTAAWTGKPGTPDRKLGNPAERCFGPDQLEAAAAWAADQDAKGRDVFFCVNQLIEPRRIKDNVALCRVVHADVDTGDLSKCPIKPTMVVQSSPGRLHAYWVLSRWVQPHVVEDFNKRLAMLIGADPAAVDSTRILRVPGTHNRKRIEWADVELVDMDEDHLIDPTALAAVLPELPKPQNAIAYRSAPVAVADDDQELLANLLERPVFGRVWQGDISDYASPSEAEWGLCCDMLRACGGDADRAESIIRRCQPLWRDKWDARRGADTYLRYTLDKAALAVGQNDVGYRSDAPAPDGPQDGHCSEHCRIKHHAKEQALFRQVQLINELIQCDLSPVFKVTLLRLVAIVGLHQSRGTTTFQTSAKRIGESISLSAQSVRTVLHSLARHDRDELASEHGLIDLDSTRVPEDGAYCTRFEVTPLTEGGYTGFLEAVVALAPELPKPAKREPRVKLDEVAPPEEVVNIPNCPEHTMHSDIVVCAGCGDEYVREWRYHRNDTPHRSKPLRLSVVNTSDIPHRSERLEGLPDHWPVYDRAPAQAGS